MTPPLPRWWSDVAAYWAAELACPPEALRAPGVSVIAETGQIRPNVFGFSTGEGFGSLVVLAPTGWRLQLERALEGRPVGLEALAAALGDACERTSGPAYLGYADATTFRPRAPHPGVRMLTADDRPALASLSAACGPLAWEHSGVQPGAPDVWGLYAEGALMAAGMLTPWGDRLMHIGIVTHPAARGRGYGAALVSAMGSSAIERGRILQYRTLEENAPSIGIARALGFHAFARTLACRLRPGVVL